MFFDRDYYSPKQIILEAISNKVPIKLYAKIRRIQEIDTIEDLSTELTKKEYDTVEELVKESFIRQTIWYLTVFGIIMNKDILDSDSIEFDYDDV